jgi:catechol O-methyltransferase
MKLKQRIPLLRSSVWRLALGTRNITTTGQVGDGREAAAADYVVRHAGPGDIDGALAAIDEFAYEKAILIKIGDERAHCSTPP